MAMCSSARKVVPNSHGTPTSQVADVAPAYDPMERVMAALYRRGAVIEQGSAGARHSLKHLDGVAQ
jgi:hypothetical protein